MSSLFTPLLWSFLPAQLTHVILPYLSSSLPLFFPPHPRGTPQYTRNYRITYTLIVIGYMVWTFYGQEDVRPEDDWYALLGVSRIVDDDGLKIAFRSLSRKYHPDRAGGENGEVFILIRRAYETLTDPTKRYAYDRFGTDVIEWKQPKTVKEFMYTGLTHSIGFYIVSGGITLILSILRQAPHGAYWRYTLFALLLYLELSLILSPTPTLYTIPFVPSSLSFFLPSYLLNRPQFIWIRTFHRIWTSLSIGINQLSGVWSDQKVSERDAMNKVGGLLKAIEVEAMGQFQGEIIPVLSKSHHPSLAETALLAQMEQLWVDGLVSSHPHVREHWKAATGRYPRPTLVQTRPRANISAIDIARRIPLPPSPPPSP